MVCFPPPLRTNKLNDELSAAHLRVSSHRRTHPARTGHSAPHRQYGPSMISISKLAFPSFSPFISHARALPGNTSAIRRQRARTPKLPSPRALQRVGHHTINTPPVFERSPLPYGRRRFHKESGQGARARYGVCSGAQTRSAYDWHTHLLPRNMHANRLTSRTGDRERVTGWSRESGWCADAPRHANERFTLPFTYLAHLPRAHLSPVAWESTRPTAQSGVVTSPIDILQVKADNQKRHHVHLLVTEALALCPSVPANAHRESGETLREHTRWRTLYGVESTCEAHRASGVFVHPPETIYMPPCPSSTAAALTPPSFASADAAWGARARCSSTGPHRAYLRTCPSSTYSN
ncbi:hypothetical protein C8R45DRAFT_1100413 [Mycena sanguinolenta]|nr:hypothetical protein C8R45DRAFT_1100413 [Mycena sanguinolenta]